MNSAAKRSWKFAIARATAFLALGATASYVTVVAAGENRQGARWLGTWASSPQLADSTDELASANFPDGLTLRQIVHVSIGGKTVRVRFSNTFGKDALMIGSAHIGKPASGGEIQRGSDKALSFRDQPSTTIPAGALIYSDPIDFEIPPLSSVTVTIYVKNLPSDVTSHAGARATSYIAAGDQASAVTLSDPKSMEHWYFLNGIEVESKQGCCAIVILGDSITDGRKSTTNGNTRWPDILAARLQNEKRTRQISVLNEGIGGNRLLHDGVGPNALARLDRDVLAQITARWVIVFEGVNDIGTCNDACDMSSLVKEILGAYQQIILRAHAHNIRVYAATITPFGGSLYATPASESARRSVNHWIRTSGWFDAVLDFDSVTRDPRNPVNLLASFDSGDHLHPGDAGYKAIADSIDLNLFRIK